MRYLSAIILFLSAAIVNCICAQNPSYTPGKVIFEDDFSNNDNKWYTKASEDYDIRIENGFYHLEGFTDKPLWIFKNVHLNTNYDYSLKLEFRCYDRYVTGIEFAIGDSSYHRIAIGGNGVTPSHSSFKTYWRFSSQCPVIDNKGGMNTVIFQKVNNKITLSVNGCEVKGFGMWGMPRLISKVGICAKMGIVEIDKISIAYAGNNTTTVSPAVAPDNTKGMAVKVDDSKLQPSAENSRYVALVIGINNYNSINWPRLNNAVNDAKAVEQLLRGKYGFGLVHSLYDENATRQNIIRELEWMVDSLSEKDNLLIYYSGHGDYKPNLNKGFWVPCDATSSSVSHLISNSEIQTFLASIPSMHTLMVSDACFSGDIFRDGREISAETNDKYYNRVYSLKSRAAISSGGMEPVMDGGQDGHSVFAYYFLKALKENSAKYIDAGQLFGSLKIPVVNNSNQAPVFSHLKNTGDEGGEFVFLKRK